MISLAITRDAIVLPLPSYSLKVVERYIGFERSQDQYGGDWAMAAFQASVGALGNIRTQTLRAFSQGDMKGILAKLG